MTGAGRGTGWTVEEAVAKFAEQGMPVYPDRFRIAVTRVARLKRTGEAASGAEGGRGQLRYDIGELQLLHAALARWVVDRQPAQTPARPDQIVWPA